jgi:hypothetical protein
LRCSETQVRIVYSVYMPRRICIALFVAALFNVAAFAQKPNFSGTWKLNAGKSDFGPLPAPESRTDVIEHSDPNLKDVVSAQGAQGKQDFTANYTTDGKEVTNKIGPREVKSTANWEGNNLVVNSKTSFNDNDITIKSSWSLSDDGKTLTQNVHFTSPMGEADQKMVYEKQEGGAVTTAAVTAAPSSTTIIKPSAGGGARPNLSGVWKLNITKSDFGVLPGPESRVDTIEHTDPTLKMSVKEEGPQGKRDYTLDLTTDGKENVNTPTAGVEVKSTSTWDGAALITNIKLKFQDNDILIKDTRTVSDDGKTMTVNSHLASPMGETDQKFVFEKQS